MNRYEKNVMKLMEAHEKIPKVVLITNVNQAILDSGIRRSGKNKWVCQITGAPMGTVYTIKKLDAFGSGMREAGQKIANTFRTFADKETVDYSGKEKKFSKTELVKKPFEAKKKLYQSMEQHLDEALDKVKSLAKEPERMKDVKIVEPFMLGAVAEPEFQYGAEAFEAYQQTEKAETAVVSEIRVQEVKGKSR